VSGFAARLVEYRNPASAHPFVTAIHFPDLGDGRARLTVSASGKTLEDHHDATTVFASLRIGPARR
jgi:hypothetical protein